MAINQNIEGILLIKKINIMFSIL